MNPHAKIRLTGRTPDGNVGVDERGVIQGPASTGDAEKILVKFDKGGSWNVGGILDLGSMGRGLYSHRKKIFPQYFPD